MAAASPARAAPLSAGAGGWRQEGRVVAPELGAFPSACPPQRALPPARVRVSNNGAESRREPRVRPAAVEEVAGPPRGGQGDAPRYPLAGVCLRARPLGAPTPGLASGPATATQAREYGASARVNLVLCSLLFSSSSLSSSSSSFSSFSPSSLPSGRCCLRVPGVWEYNSLPLRGDRFVTTEQNLPIESKRGTAE